MMMQGAAIYLLTSVPLEELTEEFQLPARQLRNGTITKQSALAYMLQTKPLAIQTWIFHNTQLQFA